jgi:hypothetical protein
MREAGIRPVAAGAPETPGTRLRGLLAALGIGHGADGQPTAPRPTGPTLPTDVAQGPGGSDLGQHIGGFAGGTLAGALERQGAQPGAHGPMPSLPSSLPPTMQQPATPPLQPQTMAPQGAQIMPGQFNPATGGFGPAQPLPAVQAVTDDSGAMPAGSHGLSLPERQYEPLSKGYERETDASRAQGQLYQQAVARQQKDAPNRAAHAALVSRFGHDQVGDYGEGMDYASLYDEMLKAETSRTEASARIAETHADRSSREAYQQGMLANGATQARASLLRAQQTGAGAGANRPPTDGERSAAGLLYEMKRGAERLKQFDNPEVLQRLASRGGMFTNWDEHARGAPVRPGRLAVHPEPDLREVGQGHHGRGGAEAVRHVHPAAG